MQLGGQVVAHVEWQRLPCVGTVDRELHVAALARHQFGYPRANPVTAPVDHQYSTADLHFAAQHLPGVDHLDAAVERQLRHEGPRAAGQHHGVRPLGRHQPAVDAGVLHNLDAGQRQLACEVGDYASELGTARQLLGQQRLAAELGARLVEGHRMAALRRSDGCLHSARPAADDHHPLASCRRLQRAVDQLAAGFRVLDAGNRVAAMEMADARLVAGDAGADVVRAALLGLGRHLGIADQRAGHPAHVGLAGSQDCLGLVRLVDPPGDEHRDAKRTAERPGIGS
ncbi:hypothetical protein D3C78_978990 [compost metagenome]